MTIFVPIVLLMLLPTRSCSAFFVQPFFKERLALQKRKLSFSLNHRVVENKEALPTGNTSQLFRTQWNNETLIQMATEALASIFYSNNAQGRLMRDDSNLQNVQSTHFTDPEKVLKKMLRRFQKSVDNFQNITTAEQRREFRKRLADLILGTSILRLRHFHTLKAILHSDSGCYDFSINDVEPILGAFDDSTSELVFHEENQESRQKVVRAMIEIHSKYLDNNESEKPFTYLLRNYTSHMSQAKQISVQHSLPELFVEMLLQQYGATITTELAEVLNEPGPITIRRNAIQCPSNEVLCKRLWQDDSITTLSVNNISIWRPSLNCSISCMDSDGSLQIIPNKDWSPSQKSIWSLDAWKDGWFEVQDAGSQIIVQATELRGDQNEVVLDYCAGNGGKTLALASEMYALGGEGSLIIAHDIVQDRLRQIKGSLDRIGLGSSSSKNEKITLTTTLDPSIELQEKMADVVLVDAPCSSTGVLRRRPSQRFQLSKEEIEETFPNVQASILMEASQYVKVGGRLVYATCSICRFENEGVVELFERSGEFRNQWEPWYFDDHDVDKRHCLNLLPSVAGSDGFFMARWRRIS